MAYKIPYEKLILEVASTPAQTSGQATEQTVTSSAALSHRPTDFESFIGQSHIKDILSVFTASANKKGSPLGHVLFYGPPGLGKTTLAGIIANQLNVKLHVINGGAVKNVDDLIYPLSEIEYGDILFIDEVHRLPIKCEEVLYEVMEDFVASVPNAFGTLVRANVPEFTLIGATTLLGDISKPMIDRFVLKLELKPYTVEELAEMAITKGVYMGVDVTPSAAIQIAQRCRNTARYVTNYLRIVKELAEGLDYESITKDVTDIMFKMLGIDQVGLESKDHRYLKLLANAGKPMGLSQIALALSESTSTVERIIEPYLQRLGLIERTARGRAVTELGIRYITNTNI